MILSSALRLKTIAVFGLLLSHCMMVHAGLRVTAVFPEKNSNTAQVNTSVRVTFSDSINANTASAAAFCVWGNVSGRHSGSIAVDNKTKSITLNPDISFIRGEKVQVILTDSITSSADGLRLSGGYSWKFQTATLLGNDTFKVSSNVITPTMVPYALATGDFNQDGYPDLAAANTDNNSISVYINNTVGGFQTPQSYSTGAGPSKIAVADINNDGAVDLIVVNTSANSVGVFKNNRSGGFGAMETYTVGAAPKALAISDINNDGSIDIVVANSADNTITVLKNDGTGNFSPAQTITVGTNPSGIVLEDLDNDGTVDGVVSNKGTRSLTILKNVTGALAVDTTYVLNGLSYLFSDPNDIAVFDFDKDGTPDLAVANGGSNDIAILLNAYSGSRPGRFTFEGRMIPLGVSPTALYGNDFDADGDIDLVMASKTAGNKSMTILVNQGLGAPTQIEIPVGKGTQGVVGADFSGQFGVIDLIAAGTDGKLRMFRNQVTTKPAGTVKASTQQITFSETAVGDTARVPITIYSLLSANKVDTAINSNTTFSLVQVFPAVLNAYDSSSVRIIFAPKGYGVFTDTLRVYSAGEVIKIAITGSSPPPVFVSSASSIAFGSVKQGKTVSQNLSWTNSTINPLHVDSVVLARGAFTCSTMSFPAILHHGDTLHLAVSFKPDSTRSYTDTVSVYNNSPVQIFRIPLSGAGTPLDEVTQETFKPQTFSLEQNFPNPFNPSTVISYQLPVKSYTSLRVFDILGREVAVLVNDIKGPGKHSVIWDAARLSSGLYLYSMTSSPIGGKSEKMFIATKKLILMK